MRVLSIAWLCAVLTGCTTDAHSVFPAFMRARAPELPPEQPPAVGAIVREQLDSIFVTGSSPHNVQVSPPHRDPRVLEWTACVKAEVTSANGRPMGSQTYRIEIVGGKVTDRRLSDNEDNCSSESYEPI